ncbi:MAG: hypothetical protein ACRD5F_09085 [Candidatus Acidiferrales bacterium]
MLMLCLFLNSAAAQSAEPSTTADPKLTYRKIFKASSPEFVEVSITQDGAGTVDIRQLDDDPDPQPIELSRDLAARMFEMAGELQHFKDIELDVKRRLANLGAKTFRYENGAQAYETTFNYTVNQAATQLMQAFEGLARQEGHRQLLQHRLRFDRLGVNDALIALEADYRRGLLPEPARLLPMLEAVAADARVIEIARSRARSLAQRIRAQK